MAKTTLDAAQKTVVGAAKAGARGIKRVASEAAGAAAVAAADVVLDRVSKSLGSGQSRPQGSAQKAQPSGRKTTSRSKTKTSSKRRVKKDAPAKRRSPAKTRAAQKRRTTRR
jgi:colicin import membrane protein